MPLRTNASRLLISFALGVANVTITGVQVPTKYALLASFVDTPTHNKTHAIDGLPIPLIHHLKAVGGGYVTDSPLYKMQEERNALFAPPVSVSMKCIINLMAQFFLVYTILFVFQVLNRLRLICREREEALLCRVAETVFLVPMLCVVFLTVRMQAVELTDGQTERYELPPWWVKTAMVVCTLCVMLHTVLVCALTLLVYDAAPVEEGPAISQLYGGYCEPGSQQEDSRRLHAEDVAGSADGALRVGRGLAMFGVYLTFGIIIAGILTMRHPIDSQTHIDTAILCTVSLTLLYFFVHLISLLTEPSSVEMDTPRSEAPREGAAFEPEAIRGATTTVAIAPMLCVLFLSARLRAVEVADWALKTGSVGRASRAHGWVQEAFAVCTITVFLMTMLNAAGGTDQQATFPGKISAGARAAEVMRCIAAACLYAGLLLIGVGLATMGISEDSNEPPPTSATLECIFVLALLYFSVYLVLWVVSRIDAARPPYRQGGCISVLKGFLSVRVKEAVSFCPMFCILFLGVLVRAQQLHFGRVDAAPQDWCLTVERIATASIVMLAAARVDAILPASWFFLANACTMLQYICLGVLYVSAIAIVIALFVMEPVMVGS